MEKINHSANQQVAQNESTLVKKQANESTIQDNSKQFANEITKKDKLEKQSKELQNQLKYGPEHLLSKKYKNRHNKKNTSINSNITSEQLTAINSNITSKQLTANSKMQAQLKNHSEKIVNQEQKEFKDQPLEALSAMNMQQGQISQVAEAKTVNLNSDVKVLLQNMVDKIHTSVISSNKGISGAEVNIHLKDSILPDTRINIQRIGTELIVSFDTSAEHSKNLLVNNESSLQKLLTEKFEDNKIQININLSQDHQGRSRNEYIADEQLDDETKR